MDIMIDFIQGQKFKAMADFIYAPKEKLPGDYDNLTNTLDVRSLKDKSVIYTHTMYAKQLFDVIRDLPYRFIVITHNCDNFVDERGVVFTHAGNGTITNVDEFTLPQNVIKWYTKNVNVKNPVIESIPIGIENDMWFPSLKKKEKINAKTTDQKRIRNLVYMNHNVNTNPAQRTKPYDLLGSKPWMTVDRGNNGSEFDKYLDNIYNHSYVICPEGNGIDTHRTWECLYVGTIPIEKRNINNQFYTDLPILFVDDWDDVTEELLSEENRFKNRDTNWNYNKLLFKYWQSKIRAT